MARLGDALQRLHSLNVGLEGWWFEDLERSHRQPCDSDQRLREILVDRAERLDDVACSEPIVIGRSDNQQARLEVAHGTQAARHWRGEGVSLWCTAPRMRSPKVLRAILAALVGAFDAEWGFVGSARSPQVPLPHDGTPIVGALTFIGQPHGELSELSPSIATEPFEGRGTLISAINEPFSEVSTQQWVAITRVSHALRRAGLRSLYRAPPGMAPASSPPPALQRGLAALAATRESAKSPPPPALGESVSPAAMQVPTEDASLDLTMNDVESPPAQDSALPFKASAKPFAPPKYQLEPSLELGSTAPIKNKARAATPFSADKLIEGMTVDTYAYLCAECAVFPDRLAEVLDRHGLDAAGRAALDRGFQAQFANDAAAYQRWTKVFRQTEAWLRAEHRS